MISNNYSLKLIVQCYVELLTRETDNNTRLVVLGKIKHLVDNCQSNKLRKTLTTFSLDILSLISHSSDDAVIDINVAKYVVDVVNSLIKDVTSCMKATEVISREIQKLQSKISVEKRNYGIKKLSSSEKHIVQYLNVI